MPKKQKVLCINDGTIYDSISDAAKKYSIDQSAISRQIKGERKTAKGYYFVVLGQTITKKEVKQLQREYLRRILRAGDNELPIRIEDLL